MIAVQQFVHVESLLYDLMYDCSYDFYRELIFSSHTYFNSCRSDNTRPACKKKTQITSSSQLVEPYFQPILERIIILCKFANGVTSVAVLTSVAMKYQFNQSLVFSLRFSTSTIRIWGLSTTE